jgi:hypothetical protein
MSDMELNKGTLIPIKDAEEYFEKKFEGSRLPSWHKTYTSWARDEIDNIEVINGIAYTIEIEEFNGDEFGFAIVDKNNDGSISFFTYHYNGGGSLAEVIGDKLEGMEE